MNRQSWTPEEDEAICRLVAQFGFNDWTQISHKLKDAYGITKRTGKQCRERWYNHLNPAVNKQPWSTAEEEHLFELHRLHGNRWKDISRNFIGRTDNDIKNHFYSTLRRSLRRLNKILGEKNSTSQMREIKPSVLSTIMNYLYDQDQGQENDLYRSLRDLPSLIFEFANFKPIKTNLRVARVEDAKTKISDIFQLITRFNQQYQQNKTLRQHTRQLKKTNSRKQTTQILPTDLLSPPPIMLPTQLEPQVKQEEQHDSIKHLPSSELCSSESFEADEILNEVAQPLKEQNHAEQEKQEHCEDIRLFSSKNMSLEDDEMEFEELQELEEPSMISCRGGDGLDLTVVGFHWQPQSWERQNEMKEFVDEVLEINYDHSPFQV